MLMVAALLVEQITTPTAWSPAVHRRIADFDLQAPAGTMPNTFRSWSRKQLTFSLPTVSTSAATLAHYDHTFEGWRRLDRTTDDGIWIDPTGTVMAWASATNGNVSISLTDFDRAAWHQRFRRNSSGERILDLAKDIR